jgi:hypothetical protein
LAQNRNEIITRVKCLPPNVYYKVEINNNTLNLENGTLVIKDTGDMFFNDV